MILDPIIRPNTYVACELIVSTLVMGKTILKGKSQKSKNHTLKNPTNIVWSYLFFKSPLFSPSWLSDRAKREVRDMFRLSGASQDKDCTFPSISS